MSNLIILLVGLTVSVGAVLFVEDRSREFWPTVFMKAIIFALGLAIMSLAAADEPQSPANQEQTK